MPKCIYSFLALFFVTVSTASISQAKDVQLTHNGLVLNGRLEVAPSKTLEDGVILMLHGTLAHHAMETISGLQDVLTERDFSTLAISLGFGINDRRGMYDCTIPATHQYRDALTELGAWVKWLKQQGAKQITLFAHSRGGAQAALYMSENPDPVVKHSVLLAPSTWDKDKASAGFKTTHNAELNERLQQARALSDSGKGMIMMKGVGVLYCAGADVSAQSFLSYYQPDPRFDTPTLLPQISIPTLVIAGELDEVVKGLPKRIEPLINESLSLQVVEGAGHFFLDLFGEDVADYMEEFLAN